LKSENFSEQDWAALSPEQQEEALRIEQAVRDFLADSRTIRYVVSDENGDALLNFLNTHGLDITHSNLLFAFDSLKDVLELVPFATPVVIEPRAPVPAQPPAPIPTAPSPREPQASRPGMVAWKNGRQIVVEPARPL